MGYRNARLSQRIIPEFELACEIRAAYQRARRVEGLRGPAALHRACLAYAELRPDVPDHLVPQRVAKLLNPALPVDGRRRH